MAIEYKEFIHKEMDPIVKICNKCKARVNWVDHNGWEKNFNIFCVSESEEFLPSMEDREVHLCIDCTKELLEPYFEKKEEFSGLE